MDFFFNLMSTFFALYFIVFIAGHCSFIWSKQEHRVKKVWKPLPAGIAYTYLFPNIFLAYRHTKVCVAKHMWPYNMLMKCKIKIKIF